jgi:MoaA/NifB/PqqE/SkfB family radical SAM enzyme
MDKDVRPKALRLEASSHCQLRCPSCPTTDGAIHPAVGSGFLDPADFDRLLAENPAIRIVELSNYGEIFLNPRLSEILRIAHERGVGLAATNGANFNNVSPAVLEDLVRYRFRHVTCSIDGASQETYARYRVRGNFERVIGNIRSLNALKETQHSEWPKLEWQFVVFGYNEHEIPEARRLAGELGMTFRLKLSWDEQFSPVRDVDMVRRATGTGFATRSEFTARTGADYMHGICHQLWDMPQINFDGRVLGCCRNFWGEFGGNAFTDGLASVINSDTMHHARDMVRGLAPPRDDVPCTTCEIYRTMRKTGRWLVRPIDPT